MSERPPVQPPGRRLTLVNLNGEQTRLVPMEVLTQLVPPSGLVEFMLLLLLGEPCVVSLTIHTASFR